MKETLNNADTVQVADQPTMSLRERHRMQTQDALVRALVSLLEEGEAHDVALATIVQRAGVSLRTAYRYFGDRAVLLEAVAKHINVEVFPWIPLGHLREMPEVFGRLVDLFEAHPRLAMVIHNSRRSGGIRGSVRAYRARVVRDLIDQSYPDVSEDARARGHAALIALDHVASWVTLREDLSLSPAEITASVGSAMSLIIDDMQRQQDAAENGTSP